MGVHYDMYIITAVNRKYLLPQNALLHFDWQAEARKVNKTIVGFDSQ
jgi:hypothetical protein